MENIRYFEELPSTNDAAREAAQNGAPAYFTVAASRQTAGRGRQGRTFASPPGGAYFSVVLRPRLSPAGYGLITPFAALAVRRAVRETAHVDLDIKWVNDLLYRGKKVCGILSESGTDRGGAPFVILGIGINTQKSVLPPELDAIAGCVPYGDDRALIDAVVRQLREGRTEMESGAFLADYRRACVSLGREVILFENGASETVFALDIAPNGGLIVQCADGSRKTVVGGEISLRPAQNDKF